jgi:hypothetical protein
MSYLSIKEQEEKPCIKESREDKKLLKIPSSRHLKPNNIFLSNNVQR